MGRPRRNFKVNKNQNQTKNKQNIEDVMTLFINDKRVIGIINEDTYVYGSKTLLVKPYNIYKLCPLYEKDIQDFNYYKNGFDKFPKYNINNEVWGNESPYSLIEVYPHKKKSFKQ